MMTQKAEIDKVLEAAGIKPTAIRVLVYHAITTIHDTFCLGDIEALLPSVDKSSIFRALTILSEHHLIHGTNDGSGALKYCLCHNHGDCTDDEGHCHFFCEKCRKTYCLEEDVIPNITLPEGFEASTVNYVVTGICSSCNKKSR